MAKETPMERHLAGKLRITAMELQKYREAYRQIVKLILTDPEEAKRVATALVKKSSRDAPASIETTGKT